MKATPKTIRTTIIFGLACGLAFIPLSLGLGYFISQPKALWMTLSVCFAVYGFFLTRWSKKPLLSTFLPVLLLFTATFLVNSTLTYLLIATAILSWIRSGICFQRPAGKRLGTELILSLGGAAFVANLTSVAAVSWALGIWLFFLIQALYFVLFETDLKTEGKIKIDPFEKAKMGAEKILSDQMHL